MELRHIEVITKPKKVLPHQFESAFKYGKEHITFTVFFSTELDAYGKFKNNKEVIYFFISRWQLNILKTDMPIPVRKVYDTARALYNKTWKRADYQANRKERLAYSKQWRLDNPDYLKKYMREWLKRKQVDEAGEVVSTNRAVHNEHVSKYYQRNRKKILAQKAKWYQRKKLNDLTNPVVA